MLNRKKISRKVREVRKVIRRKFLKDKNFTIISNNCFGGGVYQYFDLPYNSPTVGLYFFAKDYIKFLKNIKYYLNLELKFISCEESKNYIYLTEDSKKVPIGILDDVEIVFLHYKSEKEAFEKWERRKKRINWDRLVVKFNDQNNATEEDIKEFDNLDYKNKLCFVANPVEETKNVIVFREFLGQKYVQDFNEWKRHINIIKYLNNLK